MELPVFGFSVSWPLVVALVGILLGRDLWNRSYFKRKGIPGPPGVPFLGNFLDFARGMHICLPEFTKKYGKIYGFFMFNKPIYVVSDPDMVREIGVKSFSNFTNHEMFVLKNRPFDKGLSMLQDQHWKDVRNIITPTFSAAKMKKMSGLINECCDYLVRNIGMKQQKDNEVNVNSVFEAFTMDGIARCAFGLEIDSQNNPNDPFVAHAKTILSGSIVSVRLILAGVLPPVAHLMNYFHIGIFPGSVTDFFSTVVDKAMAIREADAKSEERKDFLQLLLNAHQSGESDKVTEGQKVEEEDVHSRLDEHHNMEFFESRRNKDFKLTKEEIVAQTLLFFIAGYETTNITLGFLAYSLATNPEIQDKLIQEVDEMTPDRDSVNYSSIAKMTYLDGVVCETLRLYPPAALTDRVCNETYTTNGVTFPKGVQIFFPIHAIHHDPDYWPKPEIFDPERYTKENREGRHPFAWMPFGAGPRNCVGMRFALLEIKMAVARVLQKYRFQLSPNSKVPLEYGTRNIKPEDGIVLSVIERT